MKKKLNFVLALALSLALLSGASASADSGMTEAAALVADIPTVQYFTMDPIADADVEKILEAGVNAPSAMNTQPWHFSVVTDAAVLEEIASGMSMGGMTPPSMPDGAPQGGDMPTPPDGAFPGASAPSFPDGTAPSFPGGSDAGFPSVMQTSAGGMGSKAGLTDAPLAIIVSCERGSELSAGLAVQNMSVEAQLLGYGSKIISSPTIALNGARQAEFAALLGIPDGQTAVAVLLVGYEDTGVDTTADAYTGATSRSPMSEKVTYVKAD